MTLALTAGVATALVRGPLATPLTGSGDAPDPARATGQPSVPEAPRQREYAAVLAAVADARDLDALGDAAERAYDLAQDLGRERGATPAGQRLLAAETATLQALGGLDAITRRSAATQFPAVMVTLRSAADAVARAHRGLRGSDPATDPGPAVARVVDLVAPAALRGLTGELGDLLDQAGAATKTSQLRAVATAAARRRVTLEDTVTALEGGGRLARRAVALQGAFSALDGLAAIDGDHLDVWPRVRSSLASGLAELRLPSATLDRVDSTIGIARLLMATWRALNEESTAPTQQAVSSYAAAMGPALDRLASALTIAPALSADQGPDAALAARLDLALRSVDSALADLRSVADVPDEVAARHADLLALADRARRAVRTGLDLVRAAADCGEGCTLDRLPGWADYRRLLAGVGDLGHARSAWQHALTATERAAVSRHHPAPAKPVV